MEKHNKILRHIGRPALYSWFIPECVQDLLEVSHGVWRAVLLEDAIQVLVLTHEHHQSVLRKAPAVGHVRAALSDNF